MRMLTIMWNKELDKTKITYHKSFMDSGWTAQMDVMKDVINELTNHYDNMLSQMENRVYMGVNK